MKKILALLLALTMVFALAACGQQAANSANEPVTLKIWFHGSNVSPESSQKVLDELNVYLNEKIGVKLDVIWGTWATSTRLS